MLQEERQAEQKLIQQKRAVSPLKIKEIVKKLPPFVNDDIQQEDIDNFSKIGTIGWSYVTSQILNDTAVTEKISQLRL